MYADRPSYHAGETLTAHVSTTTPCTVEVVRLGEDLDSPARDEVLHTVRLDPPVMQPVHPGSYVHIDKPLPAVPLRSFSLECWMRPWNLHEPQGVVTQLDDSAGLGLLLFPDGALGFFTGECPDPRKTPHRTEVKPSPRSADVQLPRDAPRPVAPHRRSRGGRPEGLWLDGRPVGHWEWKEAVAPAPCPLRIGALGREGVAAGLLDADIAMLAIYGRAAELEIRTRHAERGWCRPRSSRPSSDAGPWQKRRAPRQLTSARPGDTGGSSTMPPG